MDTLVAKNNFVLEKEYKFVLLILVVLIFSYFYLRAGCNNLVKFSPAVVSNSEFGKNETEYYYYHSKKDKSIWTSNKFKTKSEGISFCINDRIGF